MLSLEERIRLLEKDLKTSPPGFTMASDLPFAIFRYDPHLSSEGEWKMRKEIRLLATRVKNDTGKKVHMIPLSDLFWKSIEESEGLEAVIALEKEQGFLAAEEQVNRYLSDPDWRPLTDLLTELAQGMDPKENILFLYRAAVFAPNIYRISSLLEQLMGRMAVPAVLFYPGTWRGTLNFMGLRSDEEPLGSYRVKIYGRE
jgi:hypothetical protein